MNTPRLPLLLTFVILHFSFVIAPAAPPPELTVLRTQYEKVLAERVTAPFDTALAELNAKFTAALDKATAEAQKAGALPAVLAIEEDKKRIAGRLPLPDEDEEQTPDVLKKLRVIYREQFKKLDDLRTANQSSLLPAYTAKLQALEVTLTKAARVDEAKEVMVYRESLSSSDHATSEGAAPPVVTASGDALQKLPPRNVAEWVLSVGGDLSVLDNKKKIKVEKAEELPKGKFSIVRVRLPRNTPEHPVNDAEMIAHLGLLPDLEALDMFYLPVTDAGIQFLRASPKLTFLGSDGCGLTDAVIDLIASKKMMNRLIVANDAGFTGKGLEALKSLPITSLNFKHTGITDEVLTTLKKFKSLKDLTVAENKLTDEAVAAFQKACPDVHLSK